MKRALIVLLFALTAFAARGAEPAVAEKGVERPNVIEIRGGLTWDINSSLGYFFYAEYARNMKGNFGWEAVWAKHTKRWQGTQFRIWS